jgi:tetratricopeptide (TPR) repeat protein
MEKDSDRRYTTAGEMAADLRQYLQRGLIAARRAGPLRRAAKAARRHPVAVTIAIAAVLLVATAGSLTWVFSVRQSGEEARRALADARLSLAEGAYRQALRSVEEALAADPELAEGRLIRARVLMNLERVDEAVEEARALLEREPDDWKAHAILVAAAKDRSDGVLTIDAERHARAVENGAPQTTEAYYLRALVTDSSREALGLLDRALDIDPGNVEALVERIHRHRRMKNFGAALADCDRLVAMRPRSARARRLTAVVHLAQYDLESAMAEAERSIEIDPTDAWNYFVRGYIHSEVGRLEEAIADFTRAIEADPDGPGFYLGRARLRITTSELDLATADAERAIELDPEYLPGHEALIHARFLGGDLDGAMEGVGRLLEISDGWSDRREGAVTRFYLTEYLMRAGQAERALEEAERAVELAPEEWRSHMAVAFVRVRTEGEAAVAESCDRATAIELEEPDDLLQRAFWVGVVPCPDRDELALADYSRAVEAAPWWAEPYRARAEHYWNTKRFVEALADLDKAIELAPRRGEMYLERAKTLVALEQRYEDALADCETAIDLGTSATFRGRIEELLQQKATVLHRLGRVEEAIRTLERAVEERPESRFAYQNLADWLFRLGRIDDALEVADRLVELRPDHPRSWAARVVVLTFRPDSCERVRADLEKVRELGPRDPSNWNSEAWVHAVHLVHACPGLYDPARALELSRKAVEFWPSQGALIDTLGIVLYRNGLYEEARKVLLEAMELLPEESPLTLFSLAMTSRKLGREREARRFYDRGIARMERTVPTNPEYIRHRDEAAALLGVR